MSNTVKGFQTLQGIVQYDYESLKNKPDIDGKIQTALEEYKVDVDTTLKNAGEAADAKATGEKIAQAIASANTYTDEQLQLYEVEVDKTLTQEDQAADAASTGAAIQLINNQMTEMPYFDEEGQDSGATLINADTLGGEPAKNFAKKSDISSLNDSIEEQLANDFLDKEYIQQNYATQAFVTNKIAEAQLEGEGSSIDLSGLASIDLLNEKIDNLDYPVDSVNSKTGNIVLSAEDVGALPDAIVPIAKGGTNATTESKARQNLHVLFSTPLIASSNHTGFVIVGDSSQDRKIFVKVKMAHQNGYTCEAMFPINSLTGAPIASICQHRGTLGFTSFQYKTDGNTTSYSIKYNVSGIYAFGSLEVLTFLNTKSGHEGEIALKLDAYMSFTEVTDGTPMTIEWTNPPMTLGVEYRTTEWWQYKVVYTKLIDCGAIVNGTKQIPHGANATQMLRCSGALSSGAWRTTLPYNDGAQTLNAHADTTNILLAANFVGFDVCVQIWYTKD